MVINDGDGIVNASELAGLTATISFDKDNYVLEDVRAEKYSFTIDGGIAITLTEDYLNNGYTHQFPDTLPEGALRIDVQVTDTQGNTATAFDTSTVDTVITGSATLNIEGDDTIITSKEEKDGITFTGTLDNIDGTVSNLKVTIEGVGYEAIITGNTYSVIVPAGTLANGNYIASLSGTVTDGAGNTKALTAEQDFTVELYTMTPGDSFITSVPTAYTASISSFYGYREGDGAANQYVYGNENLTSSNGTWNHILNLTKLASDMGGTTISASYINTSTQGLYTRDGHNNRIIYHEPKNGASGLSVATTAGGTGGGAYDLDADNSGELDTNNGNGLGNGRGSNVSEAIIFDLPDGKEAFGINIRLGAFFSNSDETEKAVILLQKSDGKGGYTTVNQLDLTANNANGNFNTTHAGKAFSTGFDRVVVYAIGSDSDFVISGIEFTAPDYIAISEGTMVVATPNGEKFTNFEIALDGMYSQNNEEITLVADTDNIGAFIGQGVTSADTYFTVYMDPSDGSWVLFQHKDMDDVINFNVTGTIENGDKVSTILEVVPPNQIDTAVQGTDGVDNLVGTNDRDALYGDDGDDSLTGGLGADFLLAGDGDDILFGDFSDILLDGGAGDDLIRLDGVGNLNDILKVDGGDGMDVLLANVATLDKSKLGNIDGVEVIISGNDAATLGSDNVGDILQEIGITTEANGKLSVDNSIWTKGNDSGNYTEFSHDTLELTILVEQAKLDSGSI